MSSLAKWVFMVTRHGVTQNPTHGGHHLVLLFQTGTDSHLGPGKQVVIIGSILSISTLRVSNPGCPRKMAMITIRLRVRKTVISISVSAFNI